MATLHDLNPQLNARRRQQSGRLEAEPLNPGRIRVAVAGARSLFGTDAEYILTPTEARQWMATLAVALDGQP